MTDTERLQTTQQQCVEQWEIATEKWNRLRKAHLLETREEEKLRMEPYIAEAAQAIKQIEAQLAQIERDLRQTPPSDAPRDNLAPTDASAALREAYLHHVLDDCGRVFLGGIDPKAASQQGKPCLQLSAIYTALLTFGFDRAPEWRDKRQVADLLAHLAEQRERAASALELLNKHRRLVLLGDPGSGKSTFVSFVALCLAGEMLTPPLI